MSLNTQQIMQMPADKRYQYLLEQAKMNQQLWILTDEHGCVMLNSEDEDCVPVWPDQALAEYWATGDWAHCKAQAIALKDWLDRWTTGLQSDDLCLVVCPNPEEAGLVIEPDMFDDDLRR